MSARWIWSPRLECADVLDAIGMGEGAATLRHAERLDVGDPVPAYVQADEIGEREQTIGDLREELEELQGDLDIRDKALRLLKKAFAKWDDGRDDPELANALVLAWDQYRAVSA